MTIDITSLDAHEQPSEYLRSKWKMYAKSTVAAIEASKDIDEIPAGDEGAQGGRPSFRPVSTLPATRIKAAFAAFLADKSPVDGDLEDEEEEDGKNGESNADYPVYAHPLLPGLLIVPKLVPLRVQKRLLDRMVHRDLADQRHQTNMHLHYELPYPADGASFFTYSPPANAHSIDVLQGPGTFPPKDPSVHRPLSIQQVLDKRLHWVTLGGQYDWTNRVYPEKAGGDDLEQVPSFPPDLIELLAGLFPETDAQAAIVNFYTPGDTMMIHRDVSEETDKGLISLSMGCDALFMAAPTAEFEEGKRGPAEQGTDKEPYVLIRIRSGDAVYMSGHARFAWHGVPKVLKGTCPDELAAWPAGEHADERYEAWRGWMRNKRVNLNVRQMRD
ncbi:oxidoreductase, 2OG-Fe(II) oxygenase family [Sporothrix schenckii 1099-18]|uniref:mRNA N(6)-methyladenine demethylase n=2 Tax=Sporothrix schenckii TaxID=29908 RepID=U7PMP6_SPOS1|nr:oxidoreductase, 2OG-Fe(II) oxygenase family [Sporothrix schenckii 1099-18]ERS96216.1 alkylated DNA repair protein AlkB [Sporothrix schenckii ATCC 58251]KJR86898.1 oxidoreductase, 2OG-Fe(II) oxygenase family [Sporothrix schenckii 1099-18]